MISISAHRRHRVAFGARNRPQGARRPSRSRACGMPRSGWRRRSAEELVPSPQLGRAALVAFWDDDVAIDGSWRPSARGQVSRRAGTFGSHRCARTERGPVCRAMSRPARRRPRRSRRGAHAGSAHAESGDPVPPHERQGRSERGRRTRADVGDRARATRRRSSRPARSGSRRTRGVDLRVRAPAIPGIPTRSRPTRRSRSTTSRRSSASARTGPHRPPRRQEPPQVGTP